MRRAARLAGLSRSAAYEWHNRYEEDGIAGLRDRPRPGATVAGGCGDERSFQGTDCRRRRAGAGRGGGVSWGRCATHIERESRNIDPGVLLSSTYRLLHRIKLSWLAPRPRHPEADATAQAAFSQRLDCN